MKAFEHLFDNASFKKGTQIDFSASGKGKLVTKIDGQAVRGRGRGFKSTASTAGALWAALAPACGCRMDVHTACCNTSRDLPWNH